MKLKNILLGLLAGGPFMLIISILDERGIINIQKHLEPEDKEYPDWMVGEHNR